MLCCSHTSSLCTLHCRLHILLSRIHTLAVTHHPNIVCTRFSSVMLALLPHLHLAPLSLCFGFLPAPPLPPCLPVPWGVAAAAAGCSLRAPSALPTSKLGEFVFQVAHLQKRHCPRKAEKTSPPNQSHAQSFFVYLGSSCFPSPSQSVSHKPRRSVAFDTALT